MKRIKKHFEAKQNIETLNNVLNEYRNKTSIYSTKIGLCYIITRMKKVKKLNNKQYLFISELLNNEAKKLGLYYLNNYIWPTTSTTYRIDWLWLQIEEQKKHLIKFW